MPFGFLRRLFPSPQLSRKSERFPYPYPAQIDALVACGIWPANPAEFHRLEQEDRSLIELASVRSFAPEERALVLLPPQYFRSVAAEIRGQRTRTSYSDASEKGVDPELTLIIGDFGMGSDAALALDYRYDVDEPAVIRQHWMQATEWAPHWVPVAPTFAAFWSKLRLLERQG